MHSLTYSVLAVLRDGEADGNEILRRLADVGLERSPSLPTLYRCLREGQAAGWIEASEAPATPGPGRPPQRYSVTDRGRAAARDEALRLRALADLTLDAGAAGPGGRR